MNYAENCFGLSFVLILLNPFISHIHNLKTKINSNYILIIQSAPHSKHSPSRLWRSLKKKTYAFCGQNVELYNANPEVASSNQSLTLKGLIMYPFHPEFLLRVHEYGTHNGTFTIECQASVINLNSVATWWCGTLVTTISYPCSRRGFLVFKITDRRPCSI